MAIKPELVESAGPGLDDAALSQLSATFMEPGFHQFVNFLRTMNGACLNSPNYVRGIVARGRTLHVREILGVIEPTPSYFTVESAAELLADRLPGGMIPVATTDGDDSFLLDQGGRVRIMQHDTWEGDDELPVVAASFNDFLEAICPGE